MAQQNKIWRPLHAVLLCGAAAATAPAQGQTVRSGVEISTSAEAITNPYLDSDSDDFVGAGSIEIRPWIERETATDRVTLEAFTRLRAFTSEFDLEDTYGGGVRAVSRLSARTTAYGSLDVQSTSARARLSPLARIPGVADPIVPDEPNPIPDFPIGEDLNLIGLPGRSTSIDVQAGANRVLDARSSLGANVAYQKVFVESPLGTDYDSVSAGLSYSYQIAPRTSLGLGASVSRARYEGDPPESTTLQSTASIQHQVGPYWTLSASAGLASTSTEASRFGPEDSRLYVIGDVSACYSQPKQSICLNAGRSQQPSVLGGTLAQNNVSLVVSHRLSSRDRLEASASYLESGDGVEAITADRSIEFVSLRTSLTRSFSDRLDGYIFASGARVYEDSLVGGRLSNQPNLAFGAGLRIRLGSRR